MPDIQQYSVSIKFKTEGAEGAEEKIKKLESQLDKLKQSSNKSNFGKNIGFEKMGAAASKFGSILTGALGVAAVTKMGKSIFNLSNQTADYIETVNLFRTSMGESADKAQEFIDKAESMLGLDPKQMMDSISAFQSLSEGLGISSDRAYIMSQNLTQLAGDLSSLRNMSFETAQKKLLSGFSGQVKPLREYGIALDQASLQETAYSLGLDQKVKNMTKAQKTELIYYQIMKSSQKMQGDLGKSLLSPANALRVMKTEFTRLARAVGSIFIPMIMKIIPVVRAVTQILTSAAKAIADFFGFKMENYDADLSSVGNLLTGISDDIDGVGDSAEDTTKKLNKMLMPFDELNNISLDSGSSGGAGSGSELTGGSLGIDLPQYDMFASMSGTMDEAIEGIKQKLATLFEPLQNSWDTYGEGVMDSLTYAFEGVLGLFGEIGLSFEEVWTNGTGEKTSGLILQIWTNIFGVIGNVSTAFKNAWKNDGNGTQIIQNLADGFNNILEIINQITSTMEEFTAGEDFQRFADTFIESTEKMTDTFELFTETLKSSWEIEGSETLTNLMSGFTKTGELIGLIIDRLKPVLDGFAEVFGKVVERIIDKINNMLKVFNGMLDVIVGLLTGDWSRAWEGFYSVVRGAIKNVLEFFSGIAERIFAAVTAPFRRAYNAIAEIVNGFLRLFDFQWELPKFKLPHMNWGTQPAPAWAAKILSALSLPTDVPKLEVQWYAKGGFPEAGQLFFANEAGPELVGNIGSRTAVANQDQITTAIANATYNAISKALAENKSNDTPQIIQVNVGNEELYKGYGQYRDAQSNMLGVNT